MTPKAKLPDLETLTLRLPSTLKRNVDGVAQASGTTTTAVIREALEDFMNADRRVYELAGFREEFEAFIEAGRPKLQLRAIILAVDPNRERRVYEGMVNYQFTKAGGALVAIGRFVIPRAFVVGWFSDVISHKELLTQLALQGWTIVTHDRF